MEEKTQETRKETSQLAEFAMGTIAGSIIEFILPGHNLQDIMITSLGYPFGCQFKKYSSTQKRINNSAAGYTGAVAGQMITRITRNYFN